MFVGCQRGMYGGAGQSHLKSTNQSVQGNYSPIFLCPISLRSSVPLYLREKHSKNSFRSPQNHYSSFYWEQNEMRLPWWRGLIRNPERETTKFSCLSCLSRKKILLPKKPQTQNAPFNLLPAFFMNHEPHKSTKGFHQLFLNCKQTKI